jgi:hypothetical protein
MSGALRQALDTLAKHAGGTCKHLQVALPSIPGILSCNVELGSQHQADLDAIWERVKARLGMGYGPAEL